MNIFKKYPKDCAIVFSVVVAGIFTVMGTHFADVAEKPFWWKFWPVIAVVCGVSLAGLWLYAWVTQKRK